MNRGPERIPFYQSPQHACGYFDDRSAETLFADPELIPNRYVQTVLAAHGFRRSGEFLYRPRCPTCNACVPVRIPVKAFQPNRNQRRVLKRNRDVEIHTRTPYCDDAMLALYNRYQQQRHPGGTMLAEDREAFFQFLVAPWSDSEFLEFHVEQRCFGVAVVDRLDDALSAVYTFFDPEYSSRSPGTLAILEMVGMAERLELDWVYLGYWIEACDKMRYKGDFLPQERFDQGRWVREPGS